MSCTKNIVFSQLRFLSRKKDLVDAIQLTYNKIINTDLPIVLSNNELRLVIDEVITNAMEHGNKWDAEKRIEVNIERCYEGLRVSVKDEGDGFDMTQVHEPGETLSLRGRGIQILKHYCECAWNPEGNIFSIILPVSGAFEQLLGSQPKVLHKFDMSHVPLGVGEST